MEAMAQVNSMIYPDLASINMYKLHLAWLFYHILP